MQRWAIVSLFALSLCLCFQSTSLAGGNTYKVRVVPDLLYFGAKDADQDKHKLDLYVPSGAKNYPVLFFVHGGGWTKGSRKSFNKLGKTFAERGIGVVAISYRLSPKVRHPEHIKDVAQAFKWTYDNIGKYGGSNSQIFVSGHSAGGHLAALLATDGRYLQMHGLALKNIKGALPISGVYDVSGRPRANIFGEDPEGLKQASPINHVSKECPPFLILYAEKDGKGFDGMADDLADSLKKNGVAAAVHEMKDRTHGTIVNNIPNDNDPTTQLMLEFIRRQLK